MDPTIALNDTEIVRKLRAHTFRKRLGCQHSISAFMEYVLVAEHSRKRIKLAPHQRVGLDFIMAHPRSVNMWPVGHAKTFSMAGLTLFLLGQDPTLRGAIVSATQGQASKVLTMVRDYIETSAKLRGVFPKLRPSLRQGDPWTQTALTVDRPAGIRDPSLVAVGIDGALPGSRLNWVVVDDILTRENTATKEQRDKVFEWFDSSVLSRLDPQGGRVVVTNTAWHPNDLAHRLRDMGWPSLRMGVDGELEVWCPNIEDEYGRSKPDPWGEHDGIAHEIRPVYEGAFNQHAEGWKARLALTQHNAMPAGERTLWPERFDIRWVERMRRDHLPHRFQQLYMNICRNDDTARCKTEWIDACKDAARAAGYYGLVSEYAGPNQTYTGVDLAIQPGEEHDDTAFFTFEVLPGNKRLILDVEIGQFNGPQIVEKILEKARRYNSVVRVENNAAQDFVRQFALDRDAALPIKPHTTGRMKAHPEHGVEGLFIELANGAWLIPNSKHGHVHPHVQRWIDACLYYSPTKHTDDALMACYFAREQAKEWGAFSGDGSSGGGLAGVASVLVR